MRVIPLLAYYFWWHYTTALEDLVGNYLNLATFLRHYFSIEHLVKHLFSPWRRLGEQYPEKFNFQDFFAAVIVNTLMRLFGLVVRLLFLLSGSLVYLFSAVIFLIILVLWLFLPFAVLFLLVFSLRLLML